MQAPESASGKCHDIDKVLFDLIPGQPGIDSIFLCHSFCLTGLFGHKRFPPTSKNAAGHPRPAAPDLKDPDLLYAGIVAVQSFLLDIQAVLHPHAVDIFDIIIKVIQALGTSNEFCGHLAHIRANFVEAPL